jgi:hypothetical protein
LSHTIDDGTSSVLEDILLSGVPAEDAIKGECSWVILALLYTLAQFLGSAYELQEAETNLQLDSAHVIIETHNRDTALGQFSK